MYFKQLELSGFKSFADRTVLRLEPGITAIVGPNGCGKSNILDALRWSLGEQSVKTLRGSHMQDVIFNGSEHRQPTGMSEVSVTFDNADSQLPLDFAEVQVTRRLYRSGESEYLINKAPCRLRDIQELFMDTGIGTNAYSLIGQGKIDLVLSSKPEDRRFLFEEAAGIIKYKSRKRVAMRKLEIADQNLLRLADIIAEVQRQLRSLKRQANAAIRYREFTEELRDLEVRAAYTKYARLVGEVAELRRKFAKAQDDYEKTEAGTSKIEARNEELALARLEVERTLTERRETVHQIDSEMEKIDRQIALLRQQIDFSNDQQEQALHERDEFRQRAGSIQAQIVETASASSTTDKGIDACDAEIASKQEDYDAAARAVAESEARLETVRAQALETINSRARTQTEIETIDVGIRNVDTQVAAISDQQSALRARNEEIAGRLDGLRRAESEKREALTAATDDRRRATEEHGAKSQDVRALNEEWQSLRERKSSEEARLKSLRELRDSYEGFAIGVRAVMLAKQRNLPEVRGLIGPVGDLLSTDKAYERAIEAALGGNINNVVAEHADAAKSAIGFLKEKQAGRVTFLPLDTIRAASHDDTESVLKRPGVIGLAIQYVQYDAGIQNAVEYLMHNTVIVENLDVAIRIARAAKRYPRLVTLDGEVVSPAGAVTGGRTQHESRGLLGRSAEIGELEEKVKAAEAALGSLLKRTQALAVDINDLAQRMKTLGQHESALQTELNELGVASARCSTELESLVQSAQQLSNRREDLEAERRRLADQQREALSRAEVMDQDDATVQRGLAETQDAAAQARQALAERAAELGDLRVQLAALSQRRDEIERNKQREQQEFEEAVRNAERRTEQVQQLQQNVKALEAEIAQHIERATGLSAGKEQAQGKVIEAQNEQQTLLDETDRLGKTLRELHERTRGAQAEVHQLEMSLRHDEDQLAFLQERIETEYRISLEHLDPAKVGTDDLDEETREARVAELRDKLERLGQVNLMAIEEYEAHEKRNEFLTTQEEDLRRAREALLGVVARIDKTILEMFLDTFNRVSESFKIFFRRLFNGGQARIYLLDESDPLESGIEIEARPPGKKPQTISLLSGGEQAMTAISLLFSIFRAKPSPFCVLDEVDAPLDDANIGRFLSIVEEFTNESQFIVITHSKQTMAKANVLYGITMQERGVSQIVAVKFDEPRVEEPAPA